MYNYFKRIADFFLALISLIILTPLMFPIIIGLLLTGEGYVWFKQKRVGYRNNKFTIWKFATMLKDSENMKGGIITILNDSRITPMGGFLRSSKINELPQLLNILTGKMSFIGPRPVMQKSFDTYPEDVKSFIYNVKPGLSGLGSLVFRNEEEIITRIKEKGLDTWEYYKNEIYPYKGDLEKYYQENKGLFIDLKILIATLISVLIPKLNVSDLFFSNAPKKYFGL